MTKTVGKDNVDKFDEIKVGDRAEIRRIISIEDIEKFVELTGDDNKLHVDAEYAKTTSYKKPVAHGMLGASFISAVIGTKLPGDGALWCSQTLDFLSPVRVGDEIVIVVEVLKKNERHRIIELQTDIYNSNKQKVTTGVAKVKVIKQVDQENGHQHKRTGRDSRKVALVIGASGGIGAATARKFARNGYDLVLHYNSHADEARRVKDESQALGVKAITVRGDLRDPEAIQELYERVTRFSSHLNVMVNAAAVGLANISIDSLEWDDIQRHIDMDVKVSFLLTKRFATLMEHQDPSGIVFVSTQAVESPVPSWLHYITAKSALVGLAKCLAIDLARKGIRVNLVSPGMTDTDLISNVPEKARLLIQARSLRGRLARPIDVANAIYFVASDDADYLTGETIRVNGGQVMI